MATQKVIKHAEDLEASMYQPVEMQTDVAFFKAQFLASQSYSGVQKDILTVVLEDGQRYTRAEAEAKMNQFKHKGVK